jgi:hypothetical protein
VVNINHHISLKGECKQPLNVNTGKETRITLVMLLRQVHQIITPVINLLHTKNLAKSRITSQIKVFIAPKSNKTDVVKQIVDRMDVDNEDAV